HFVVGPFASGVTLLGVSGLSLSCFATHALNSASLSTTTGALIVECPTPQSSVQIREYSPSTSGVTTKVPSVSDAGAPGTASRLIRHSGTQKERRTSSARRLTLSCWSTGTWSSREVTPCS